MGHTILIRYKDTFVRADKSNFFHVLRKHVTSTDAYGVNTLIETVFVIEFHFDNMKVEYGHFISYNDAIKEVEDIAKRIIEIGY